MTYEEQPDAAVLSDAEKRAAQVNAMAIDPDAQRLVLVRETHGDGVNTVRPLSMERYAERPQRRKGAVEFDEPASLVEYVNEFRDDATRFYCSLVEPQAIVILNDDDPKLAGEPAEGAWRDHVAILRLVRTPEWERWRSIDGAMMTQTEFAEFLELNVRDVIDPDSATLIEIARSFTVGSDVQYRSAQRLSTGETSFAYEEQHTTSAGAKGDVAVPEAFTLLIAPFQGTEKIPVIARLRYRLRQGNLTLGVMLDNAGDVERDGFRGIVEGVGEQISKPVLYGRPAGPATVI